MEIEARGNVQIHSKPSQDIQPTATDSVHIGGVRTHECAPLLYAQAATYTGTSISIPLPSMSPEDLDAGKINSCTCGYYYHSNTLIASIKHSTASHGALPYVHLHAPQPDHSDR